MPGFDTTANTMAYAIALLASFPEWQEWMQEELDQEIQPDADLNYESTYPVLKRCLATMVILNDKPYHGDDGVKPCSLSYSSKS